MIVRLATLEDAAAITRHRERMFLDMGLEPERVVPLRSAVQAWLTAALADGRYVGLLGEDEGDVIGGAGLTWPDLPPAPRVPTAKRAYLLNVYVEPTHRGRGVAKRLVQSAIDEARARGVTELALHASQAGRPLYEKLGFAATNEMRLAL